MLGNTIRESMEHIAPLLQTLLWVLLIGGIVLRFHTPIHGLLTALQKRIESGSNIKAGPFELSEQLRPQDPSKQREKAEIEVQEVLLDAAPVQAGGPQLTPTTPAQIQARYFQVEDLALRAIQAEHGVTISRQVTAGPADMGFDGVFTSNGRIHIVEVKYARSLNSLPKFKQTIERLNSTIVSYGWKNAQIILAVVFEDSIDVTKAQEMLAKVSSVSQVPLVVKCYTYAELNWKFGVSNQIQG